MRAGSGKAKGNDFERVISKELSLWISEGLNPDLLWRSQASGGRATIAARKGLRIDNQDGDIASSHPDSADFSKLFVIECKFYRSIGIEQFVFLGSGPLRDFWNQVVRDSERSGKIPLLIAKQNRRPIVIMSTFLLGVGLRYAYFSSTGAYLFDFKELLSCPYKDVEKHVRVSRRKKLSQRS